MRLCANMVCLGVAAFLLGKGRIALGGNPFVSADRPFNRAAAEARAEFQVSTDDGVTRVVYRGKRVFTGKTSGQVLARRMKVDGGEYAAVWDDEKVVWQSAPGAVGRMGAETAGNEPGSALRPITFRSPEARLRTTTAGGETAVFFNDQRVFLGPTHGLVTTKSKVAGGSAFAAAWDGDRLLWENAPGAAGQLQ